MKKNFKVTAVNNRVNSKNEPFVSIDMKYEKQVTSNGCISNVTMWANYACISTTLVVDDIFVFDDDVHHIDKYEYTDAKGVSKIGYRIKNTF